MKRFLSMSACLVLVGCQSTSTLTTVTATGRLVATGGTATLSLSYLRGPETPKSHLSMVASPGYGALTELSVTGTLQDGFAPSETYILTSFFREVTGGTGPVAGDLAWFNDHSGSLALTSFRWYDPDSNEMTSALSFTVPPPFDPDGDTTLQPIPRIGGAVYLTRHREDHVVIPWSDSEKSLDMQRLTNSVFGALSSAITGAANGDPTLSLAGLDRAGDFRMTFVPRSDDGRAFTYVFYATLDFSATLGGPFFVCTFVIPITVGLLEGSPAGGGQVGYEADLFIETSRVTVFEDLGDFTGIYGVLADVTGISQAATVTALTRITGILTSLPSDVQEQLDSARIFLSLGLILDYRATLADGAEIIVLPEQPIHGIESTRVAPAGTRIELHFLE